jgi:hypothetical protein
MSRYECLRCERILSFTGYTPDACDCGGNVVCIERDATDLAIDLSIEQFEQNSAALYDEAFAGPDNEFAASEAMEMQRTAIAWGGVALVALAVLWMLPSGMEACQAIHSHDACFAALNR